ncbi:MAG: hypothetical protein KGI71_04145, partial [Patescibacteria group bacterium]|nr:hypothetical protein [Patescibacteria group bacterium]
SDYYSFASNSAYNITGDLSLLWSGAIATGSGYRSFAFKGSGNGSTNCPFDFRTDNSATPKVAALRSNATTTTLNLATSVTISLGVSHQVGASLPVGGGLQVVYLDGASAASSSVGAYTVTSNSNAMLVGRRADGAVQMNGNTEFVIGWASAFDSGAFAELWAAPYQLVRTLQTRLYFGATAGGGVTVGLTGVSATGSVGSLGLTASVALSGISASGSVGTVVASPSFALSGVSNSGSVGALAPSAAVALSGVSAAGATGTVTATIGVVAALTGVSATGSVGSLGVARSKALSGVRATGSAGSVSVPGSAPAKVGGIYPSRKKFLIGKRLIEVSTQAELEYALLQELQSERETKVGKRRHAKPERVTVPEVVEIGKLNARNVELVSAQARLSNAPEVLAAVQRLLALARGSMTADYRRLEEEREIEMLLMSIH